MAQLLTRIPSQCRLCHAWPSRVLCGNCVQQFAQPVPRCQTCALPVPAGVQQCGACITAPPPVDAALAAVHYAYPWSDLIQDFKFHAHPACARTLAGLMRSTPWVEPALEAADWLIPMPLFPLRLRERGFNQALLLAYALDRHKTQADALLRIAHSAPQHTLARQERVRNLQAAFAVEPAHYAQVQGKRVVVVDDVMTTGASMHAVAQVLRAAGAAHITALVFARTE